MRYYLTLVRLAVINKPTNKCRCGGGQKGTLVHCWWECRPVRPLWKAVWRYPQNLKMELNFDPVIPLLGISKEIWNTNSKEYMHPYVLCSVIYNGQYLETSQLPVSRWVDVKAVVCLHNGFLLSGIKKREREKKEENLSFYNSMGGTGE